MKICILGENGSVHIQKWIKALSLQTELEIHVITFNRGAKFEGVHYHYLKKITNSKLDYILNLFCVKSLVKSIKPDVVHAHYATSYGLLGAFSGFHPYIITGWGADIFDSPENFWMKKILKFSFNKADAISVLSKITLAKMADLTNKDVSLIPFGVDLKKFSPHKPSERNIIRIGTIRTLTEKYGVEYLIRAFAEVCQKYNNLCLDIVGDGPLREYLTNLTIELNIEDKVVFHGYVNQNTETKKYMALLNNMDIFAILSIIDSETFGVAAVEASACEIPVVATCVGGLTEVIDSEKTGIIVPPKNVEETAAALERLISDESLRIKMGKSGREKVEENYNWENNLNQMINLYKETYNKFKGTITEK